MRAERRADEQVRHEAPPRRILVPVDFSQASTAALMLAGQMSAEYAAELTVINVLPAGSAPTARKAIEEALKAEVRHAIGSSRFPVRVVTREAETVEAILNEQTNGGHDMIVMGTHVVGLPEEESIGSTASRVVRGADCSVRLVRFSITGEEAAVFSQPLRSFAMN